MAKNRQQPKLEKSSPVSDGLEPGRSGDQMLDLALKYSKMGRPKKHIDWTYLDFLCGLQCTLVEIATAFDCSEDTIENRIKAEKGMTFSEYYRLKRSLGHLSLRRRQFLMAQKHVAMAIFLGKNYLDQSDHQTITGANGKPLIPEAKDVYEDLAATLLKLGIVFPAGENGGNGSAKRPTNGKKKAV